MKNRRLAAVPLLLVLAATSLAADDAAVEEFLRNGKVLEIEEIGSGITRPKKVLLEWNGETRKAAFKNVALTHGRHRMPDGGYGLSFTDQFRYERAAYLLDRHLGLHMVPVVVLREIEGEPGALIQWVSGAVNEMDRRNQELNPPDPATLIRQRDVMKIFDALIRNEDRNLSNELITTDDWRLHLIDHSRSFRVTKKLTEGFDDEPVSLPRGLYEKLKSLELDPLRELLGELLSTARIKAILARRDRLVKKIDQDRKEYGDEFVFHPEG